MGESYNDKELKPSTDIAKPQSDNNGGSSELTQQLTDLKKAYEDTRNARRAALNLMEDAILSREALRKSEEKYRTKLEQDVRDRTEELNASKNLLQATMDASMDMIQVFEAVRNEQGEIRDFKWILNNHTSEKYYGDVIGKSLLQNNPGVIEAGIFDAFKRVIETGIPDQSERHYVHEQFNGWFYQSVVKLGDGVATTTTDITERKKAELQLQEKNAEVIKHHNILKQAEEIAEAGSWEYDLVTKAFIWSDGMYRLFEMKNPIPVQPEIYVEKATDEDKHVAEKIVQILKEAPRSFEETLNIKVDGKIKALKIKATVINDDQRKSARILGVDLDITAAKEAEGKIGQLIKELSVKNRELETANSELRTFSSVAASDYKETLKHLYTLFEFIVTNEARNFSNTGKANVRRAQASVQKLKLLTDDIVAYAEVQTAATEIKEVFLSEIFDVVLQKLSRKIEDTGAVIKLDDSVQKITGYPNLLSLLFYHLIDNAIKFRKPDAPPVIELQYSNVPGTSLHDENADPAITYFVVSVIDNGIGIDPLEKEKIFEMFYKGHDQTKHKGSGIGLAICRKIMDIHHGFITAESTPGEVTVFKCFFPL